MKWYSVKKYKPIMGNEYIVTDGDFVYASRFLPGREWVDTSNDDCEIGNITHFCIPEPIEVENIKKQECNHHWVSFKTLVDINTESGMIYNAPIIKYKCLNCGNIQVLGD